MTHVFVRFTRVLPKNSVEKSVLESAMLKTYLYLCFNEPATMQMVAGRFVNVYSTNDWTLGITFRARYGLPI